MTSVDKRLRVGFSEQVIPQARRQEVSHFNAVQRQQKHQKRSELGSSGYALQDQ